ncbi:MAG: VWA domain-containing protein [Pyrinomonadaceae bacterium]
MRFFLLVIFCLSLAVSDLAQSGRNKQPDDSPPPRASRPKPSAQLPPSQILVKANPVPTPTPPENNADNVDDNDEVIKVESSLVPIPASVTDASGNAVTNLKLEDFALMVDGKAQEISEISRSDTPVRLALLFDNSSSVNIAREFEIKAAIKFLKKVLRPDRDRAALYSISSVSQLAQPLTSNTRLLIAAIEAFPPPAGATALLDGVVQAANYLRDFNDGRHVIVIVSDGVDTLSDVNLTLAATIRKAQLADCQIYVVKTTDFESLQRTGRRGSNANTQDLTAERRMQELTAQTGGAVYSPLDEKELDVAFANIAADLAQQYVLSYYPADTRRDGSFKQIDLQVKSNKNLTVRTRKGYYVPKS